MKAPFSWPNVKTLRHSKEWYKTQKLVKFGIKHTKKKFRRKLMKTGYVICPDCKGERLIKRKIEKFFGEIRVRRFPCLRCHNHGFVDWVDRITGGNLR